MFRISFFLTIKKKENGSGLVRISKTIVHLSVQFTCSCVGGWKTVCTNVIQVTAFYFILTLSKKKNFHNAKTLERRAEFGPEQARLPIAVQMFVVSKCVC